MEQKNKITSLQELFDFIEHCGDFNVFDKDEDSFIIEAPNKASFTKYIITKNIKNECLK